MIVVDATLLVALVLGTASHLRATLFASSIVSPALQQFTLDLLIHVTAAALYDGRFVARWTLAQVAPGGTNMVRPGAATGQLLPADSLAHRDCVQTGFAFALHDGLFAARA